MTQRAIPFLFMRGGTSRGPYLNRADLPDDRAALSQVLIAMIGAGHPLTIDGIGGGAAVTTKVAILSRAEAALGDANLADALAEIETLPPEAVSALASWIDDASTRLNTVLAVQSLSDGLN